MLSSKIIWKANVGKNCRIIIKGKGKITLSNGVYIDDYCTLEANDGVIEIEKGCYFNNYSRIVSKSFIRIGRDCLFGSNVSIYNHDHDVSEGGTHGEE